MRTEPAEDRAMYTTTEKIVKSASVSYFERARMFEEWLERLANAGTLTRQQAALLSEAWPEIDDDTWAQPWFRGTGEHTRAYICAWQLRGHP